MFGSRSTSESDSGRCAHVLIASLNQQPLLVVQRAEQPVTLRDRLACLEDLGVRHVEIAWSRHPAWAEQVVALRQRHPLLLLGAASITSAAAVRAAASAGLAYAMAPVLDPQLHQLATAVGLLLVPGVFSPSEVKAAMAMGNRLVKLFPAASLGAAHWRRLREPLAPLPFCIAAGGLSVSDVDHWLAAGVDAVTLGASVSAAGGLNELKAWLQRHQQKLP